MTRGIEIIGGGLAGLSLGLALQRDGVAVTIFEAGEYPRHRVCGEFITGLDRTTIAKLGLAPILGDALRHREVAWFFPGEPPQVAVLPAPALGISRHRLDARLVDAFVAAGGTLRAGTRVVDLKSVRGRVHATGRVRGRSAWIGLKLHLRGVAVARDLEMHLGKHAYVGLTRVDDETVNVCGLFRGHPPGKPAEAAATLLTATEKRASDSTHRAGHVLTEHLLHCGLDALAKRLRQGSFVEGSFCAVAALEFTGGVIVDDRISLGDAYAMIPPFTGNGMAMAFQSASAALEPLRRYARDEATWEQTCAATNAALRGRFRKRLLSARILHPFLYRPRQQRWVASLSHAGLLPFRTLYSIVH